MFRKRELRKRKLTFLQFPIWKTLYIVSSHIFAFNMSSLPEIFLLPFFISIHRLFSVSEYKTYSERTLFFSSKWDTGPHLACIVKWQGTHWPSAQRSGKKKKIRDWKIHWFLIYWARRCGWKVRHISAFSLFPPRGLSSWA